MLLHGSDGMSALAIGARLEIPWWFGFALSLVLPVSTLAFLAIGPHRIELALLWTLPVWVLVIADRFGPRERRKVPGDAPRWFFDGLLYLLAALQCLNVLALGFFVSALTWAGPEEVRYSLINLLALRIVIGTNPCCAAIAPAHELIHRRSPVQRLIGRVMLLTVCYDHFWIAHRVGHHARLGSSLDPSTALGHEGFEEFFRKSVTRQWQVAWRYGSAPMLVGLTLELGLLVGFAVAFGGLAAMFLAYQSLLAVRLLETVNYFQHFGLTRDSTRSGATAWRCDSAVSLFLFLGLPRHADHHRRPAVPFTDLEATDRGPHLPCGYLWAAIWVRNANRSYRTWASAHLASEGAA